MSERNYRVRRAEMLRYLGHRGQQMDKALCAMVEECAALCEQAARPRTVWRRLPVCETAEGVLLGDALFPGADLARQLSGGDACILMAATLGVEIDLLVHRLQPVDPTRSVLVDAAASSLIEVVCDALEDQLRADLVQRGEHLGGRFSPGYGDLPLPTQPLVITLLNTPHRIGLHCNEGDLLLPRKSVTAILGIQPKAGSAPLSQRATCARCNLRGSCAYCSEGAWQA